ncbi:MAG: imidazolonepropionase, partial [Cytophaga sp.]|nr:imidazolonepropionase [Cytophaga sp.]
MPFDVLIVNIKGLVQTRTSTPSFVAGEAMAELPVLENAYVAIKDGLIAGYGTMDELVRSSATQVLDATGRFIFPSFVDSHTHLIFAAPREEEFVMKIKGVTYEEIAAKGGGILNSAKKLQATSEEELFERALQRVDEIIKTGTGAVEIKSGYGLTLRDELKMLRV